MLTDKSKLKKRRVERLKNEEIDQNERKSYKNFLFLFFLGFLISFCFTFFLLKLQLLKTQKKPTQLSGKKSISSQKVSDFLFLEKELYFAPLDLIEVLKTPKKDILIVDVRDPFSFKKGHIKGAVNFSSLDDFQKIKDKEKKTFITYGDFTNDPKVKMIAYELINQKLKVKILAVGYNEFRHLKILWLSSHLWDKIKPEEFVEEQ